MLIDYALLSDARIRWRSAVLTEWNVVHVQWTTESARQESTSIQEDAIATAGRRDLQDLSRISTSQPAYGMAATDTGIGRWELLTVFTNQNKFVSFQKPQIVPWRNFWSMHLLVVTVFNRWIFEKINSIAHCTRCIYRESIRKSTIPTRDLPGSTIPFDGTGVPLSLFVHSQSVLSPAHGLSHLPQVIDDFFLFLWFKGSSCVTT